MQSVRTLNYSTRQLTCLPKLAKTEPETRTSELSAQALSDTATNTCLLHLVGPMGLGAPLDHRSQGISGWQGTVGTKLMQWPHTMPWGQPALCGSAFAVIQRCGARREKQCSHQWSAMTDGMTHARTPARPRTHLHMHSWPNWGLPISPGSTWGLPSSSGSAWQQLGICLAIGGLLGNWGWWSAL